MLLLLLMLLLRLQLWLLVAAPLQYLHAPGDSLLEPLLALKHINPADPMDVSGGGLAVETTGAEKNNCYSFLEFPSDARFFHPFFPDSEAAGVLISDIG